jgi:hypothetical protein
MNIKNIGVIFLLAFCIIFIFKICDNSEHFEDKNKELVTTVKRPYVNIYDNNGNKLNVILISKPFGGDNEYKIYEENKKNNIFIGIASYLEFPAMVSNPFENFTENYKKYKYTEICDGWIHGFRNPETIFPPDIPLLFASESDWIDCNNCKPDSKVEKIYDFVYICLKVDEKKDLCEDWATYNKNWPLGQKCLDIFCNKYKLKGLLIGRKGCKLPQGCHYMETTNMLDYNTLKNMYQKSKFIFLPNQADASPRVLTEALATNVPCFVNDKILGGWKYVNEKTGEFFNEDNIEKPLEKLLENIKQNTYNPRDYIIKNYSVVNSGRRLKDFLYNNFSSRINIPKEKVDYITIENVKKNFETCKASQEL